jgi:hypothetical protein
MWWAGARSDGRAARGEAEEDKECEEEEEDEEKDEEEEEEEGAVEAEGAEWCAMATKRSRIGTGSGKGGRIATRLPRPWFTFEFSFSSASESPFSLSLSVSLSLSSFPSSPVAEAMSGAMSAYTKSGSGAHRGATRQASTVGAGDVTNGRRKTVTDEKKIGEGGE